MWLDLQQKNKLRKSICDPEKYYKAKNIAETPIMTCISFSNIFALRTK